MKILYHHRIASKDGQAVHLQEVVDALRGLGHDVLIVGPRMLETQRFGFEGGFVAKLKKRIPGFVYESMEFLYNLIALTRILAAARRFKPDVIYERYNLYFVAGLWAKKLLGLPLILEVNAPLFAERLRFNGLSIPSLARATERYAWRNADKVLPVTQVLADMVAAEGVDPRRLHVVPNGINMEEFSAVTTTESAKAELGLTGRTVLGFTGFMREWHGLTTLVDIIAEQPTYSLLIVGDGPARKLVEDRAKELNVSDRTRITGIVARHDIAHYVAAFDIALQPDVVDYASPLKLFEYMVLARAIVAPDKPNIREVLVDNSNAVLFRSGDHADMGRAIRKLCEDVNLRERVGNGARATIFDRDMTWVGNARTIAKIASELSMAKTPGATAVTRG